MNKLKALWLTLDSSLWFVPTLMVVAALFAAYGLVHLDLYVGGSWTGRYPLLFGAGAAGARGMLAAIAGSMITVAGLIFSLTLATLAQVASQYTSRLLRNFMRDRTNQVVMGFFVSIFVYCLVVLRTIRGGDEGSFVPSLAVAFGLLLALVSIGMLIFFIHHIASSIQAANIVAGVAAETEKLLDKVFPRRLGDAATPAERAELAAGPDLRWRPLPAPDTGYVQGIDHDALLSFAQQAGVVVRMEYAIGSFVVAGSPLASVTSPEGQPLPDIRQLTRQLADCYRLGNQRTLDQDVGFGLRQLVDIALKALSPGINDVTTAVMCVDRLGALLRILAGRHLASSVRAEAGQVRVLTTDPDFASYLGTAFDQIRANAASALAIYLRQLAALRTIAAECAAPAGRAALRRQADLNLAAAEANLTARYDLDQVQARYQELRTDLEIR
ncbi:putative membrane protein [Hymenobacter sp. UYAg731]